jgi:thioesterase domain-containing protein
MARQLRAAGQKVPVLAMVDCYSEHHPNTWPGKLLYKVQRTIWRTKRVLARGPKGVAEWVVRRSRSFSQQPSEVEDTFGKLRVVIDAYHQQLASYPGKSVVFIGEDSYKFCGLSTSVDPRLIWRKLTTGGSEVRRIPGDHTDLLEAPMMYRFAEELKSCLERSCDSIS